jgi:hypothetical protein
MPDHYRLCAHAADTRAITLNLRTLDFACASNETDSTRAASEMTTSECACVITLGGDGTNRAVAKGCGETPILAISTGTNNVVPRQIEGTIAGLAAGCYARELRSDTTLVRRTKRLEVLRDGQVLDIALVDLAVSTAPFVGSRAITDLSMLDRLWLAEARPGCIGLAAIGAGIHPFEREGDGMLELVLADNNPAQPECAEVLAPIAPGIVRWAHVASWRVVPSSAEVSLAGPCTLAFDGERSTRLDQDERYTVRATWNGPRMLDAARIMEKAAHMGLFRRGMDRLHPD